MPTFEELRNKAAKVADAGASKVRNTRDHMTSQPSKNINWDAQIKSKPPPPPKPPAPLPPPSRTGASSTLSDSLRAGSPSAPPVPLRRAGSSASSPSPPLPAGPPPVIRRSTRPDLRSSSSSPSPPPPPGRLPPPPSRTKVSVPKIVAPKEEAEIDRIDWANLSPEDKEAFFSWLDEFFARYLKVAIPPRATVETAKHVPLGGRTSSPMPGPPSIPKTSPPKTPPRTAASSGALTSYPPSTEHGSAAADLAHYFHPSTHWPSAWYASDDTRPPPLRQNSHISWTSCWKSDGRSTKTVEGGVLFSDLSMCWYSVSWPLSAAPTHDPNDARTVTRLVRFLPRPGAWTREQLVDAHETYGETVAGYAESYEGTGQACARGECWDLANEALKNLEQYDYVPKPVPSIARTHGHLIYEGRATDKGRTQAGRWRGGDDRVRRGDIIEWRSARVGMGGGGWAILGDPEHTAVIVSDSMPRTSVGDGMAVRPAEMGTVVVVEQSVGKPPVRASYDLANLEEGEVWIYRPVGLEAYVGAVLTPTCPEGLNTLTL